MYSATKVKELCRQTLPPIGIEASEVQNGTDFYKHMFTNHPDLRVYFKGAENYDAEKVQNSERFAKQGQRILLANYILVNTYDDPVAFKAYARETVDRHRQFKMAPELWHAFFSVFVNYLSEKKDLTKEQREAWAQLGKDFADECNTHLKNKGLPHA
ncbi:hypothetical protein FO519_003288 [Halicephalobus sp. NKZ332]|nr:hypothetical protein FO519_003288 [Halicephalobus sp. NKZ332]